VHDGVRHRTDLIARSARAVLSLAPAVRGADELSEEMAAAIRAQSRGYFTPEEDERVRSRFALYLTGRAGLLQTIEELRPFALPNEETEDRGSEETDALQLRAFVVAYTAACLLVRAGRFIVKIGTRHPLVRRKLDEAEPRFGIPAKQFTAVYKSLSSYSHAYALRRARVFAARHAEAIDALAGDSEFAPIVQLLRDTQRLLRIRTRTFLRARLRYRGWSWKRRQASAWRKTMFAIFEASGRVIADMRNPFHEKRVTNQVRARLLEVLRPGDVIITRHDDAMSNLFLPGFWPHAALYIGPETVVVELDLQIEEARRLRWREPLRVLEARKDGVLLRELADTLRVDAFTVIRPRLEREDIRRALARALTHEGKLYDFEFDFSRADRLVCTEVVYRAFDGIGPMRFELKRRAGRLTFSAEDLLDLAISGNGFEPVAVFGVPGLSGRLVLGEEVTPALTSSYRKAGDS